MARATTMSWVSVPCNQKNPSEYTGHCVCGSAEGQVLSQPGHHAVPRIRSRGCFCSGDKRSGGRKLPLAQQLSDVQCSLVQQLSDGADASVILLAFSLRSQDGCCPAKHHASGQGRKKERCDASDICSFQQEIRSFPRPPADVLL